MQVDDRLFVELSHANGRKSRWGPDDPDAAGIPGQIALGNSAPGGHRDFSCSLLRDPRRDWPDLDLFDDVRVYGRTAPLGRSAFEGRQEGFPSELGERFAIGVNAIGHQAELEDDQSFREIYRDTDLTRWGPASTQEKINNPTYSIHDPTVEQDATNGPRLVTGVDGGLENSLIYCPALYDAQGVDIGSVYYEWARQNVSPADPNYIWEVRLGAGDTFGGLDLSGDLQAAGPGSGTLTAAGAGRKFALAYLQYGLASDWVIRYAILWRLVVHGNHGLTKRGAEPDAGFYGHDILAHALSKGAPGLNHEVGRTIAEITDFVVPDMAFREPTTAAEVVQKLNAYYLFPWAVWDRREFWWQPWDPGRLTWKARIQGGAQWTPAGRQGSTLFNGVIVSYTDEAGQARTAGPPGSGCDTESALLEDTDSTNPANSHGLRRWAKLDVGFPLTGGAAGSAVQLGYVWLQEAQYPQRRGELVVKPLGPGHIPQIEHPTLGPCPVWAVRAGDFVELVDFPDREPFKVLEVSYDHATKTLRATLDNTLLKLSAILERVGISLAGKI